MSLDRIRQRYAGQASQEWERLCSTPITRIEYMITSHCLKRHLPGSGRVLDAGCGPGRYAIDLAQQGYQVVMYDLVREMLLLGRRKIAEAEISEQVVSSVEGDISALPYAADTFDAVVCLGAPLSHLPAASMRVMAVEEMARVARPGGVVFLTGIARLAGYRGIIYWLDVGFFDQIMKPEDRARGIVDGSQLWYTFTPGELEALVCRARLRVIDRVGCEGLASYLPMEHLAQIEMDPKRWAVWREILFETCNEPTIIGVSNHLLVVARKDAS